ERQPRTKQGGCHGCPLHEPVSIVLSDNVFREELAGRVNDRRLGLLRELSDPSRGGTKRGGRLPLLLQARKQEGGWVGRLPARSPMCLCATRVARPGKSRDHLLPSPTPPRIVSISTAPTRSPVEYPSWCYEKSIGLRCQDPAEQSRHDTRPGGAARMIW